MWQDIMPDSMTDHNHNIDISHLFVAVVEIPADCVSIMLDQNWSLTIKGIELSSWI
jgi:hypothetical protein